MRMTRRNHRTVTDIVTIGKKTFRFGWMMDATGYRHVYADEWTGWQWVRRHQWSGQKGKRN